ncbi:hypothetical protein PanWU01x14_307080, partial [Parasponia andersonii]
MDTTCFGNTGFIGFGGIIRDYNGLVKAAFCQKLSGTHEPLVAKLLAIRTGLLFAIEYGLIIDITESGSCSAITLIQFSSGRETGGDSCRFFPRTGNEATHTFARNVISCNSDCSWFWDIPSCIATIVASD